MKKILLGNEAIVQGALEAGVNFVSVYPGTPSSEIGNTFAKIAKDNGVYFEFSTNEKVALEASIGASFSGMKCLVAMKSFGLNVASDALLPLCYTGTKGPMVIIVADDPSCWSSGQSEENSRAFAYLGRIPILEPSDAQEAKDFTILAFEISEKFNLPVIVRTTTRVAHQRMPIEISNSQYPISKPSEGFIKSPEQFSILPNRVLEMKAKLLEKLESVRKFTEKDNINQIKSTRGKTSGKLGIVVSGVSYLYVKEILEKFNLELQILKLGFFYPLPEKKIKNFIGKLKKVLVVEELDAYLEKEIKILAKEANCKLEILGKNVLPEIGELNTGIIIPAIGKLIGRKLKTDRKAVELEIPSRTPRLCPGCPYWAVFEAVKRAAPEGTIFGGDIGCYMIAGISPHNLQDYLLCMGSSASIAHGIEKSSHQKIISFMGDSTFFHSGAPALINAVYNKSNQLIVIMDNRITAMTGHQPNPGMGKTGMGEESKEIKIEDVAKACGVENVKVVDSGNVQELENAIKDLLANPGVSLLVARQMCALLAKKLKK